MKKGMLVVFEGIDGSGKDTHLDILYNTLTKDGYKVAKATQLNDNSITGNAIRQILSNKEEVINDVRMALVYLSEMVSNTYRKDGIVDLLNQGYIVLCNRYHYSTTAYAGSSDTVIDIINSVKQTLPTPDIVYLVDVDVKIALSRLGREGDFYEKEDKLKVVKERYNNIKFANSDNNIIVIDNNGYMDKASEIIYNVTKYAIQIKDNNE